jgi:hypothetical protein
MIKYAFLSFGYAESGVVAPICCQARVLFETEKEALKSLAHTFFENYVGLLKPFNLGSCCKKSEGQKFCSKCGKKLIVEVDPYKYEDYIVTFGSRTWNDCHEFSSNHWEFDFSFKEMMASGVKPNEILEIDSYAERVLIKALDSKHPEFGEQIKQMKREFKDNE